MEHDRLYYCVDASYVRGFERQCIWSSDRHTVVERLVDHDESTESEVRGIKRVGGQEHCLRGAV